MGREQFSIGQHVVAYKMIHCILLEDEDPDMLHRASTTSRVVRVGCPGNTMRNKAYRFRLKLTDEEEHGMIAADYSVSLLDWLCSVPVSQEAMTWLCCM